MEKELKEREIITEEDIDKNNPAYFENNEKELKEIEAIEERELKELELMNENENREFYVYEHIRLDNNTPFYVGKGTGNRAHNLDRGNFHNGVRDSYGCKVVIIKDKLTESQAFRLEKRMIEYYVFTLGYGIPIDEYMHKENNKYLTNFTWGGEGSSGYKHSEETKEKIRGKNNPMFGKNAYANKTPEEMEIIRKKKSEAMKGKNKGKNSFANKTDEEMEIIRKKKSEAMKGKKHSDEHNEKISEAMKGKNVGKHHTEEAKKKISEANKGEKNPRAKKVICITTGKIFNTIKDAINHYHINKGNIISCCKGKRNYAGKLNGTPLQWMYLEDYNNEFKGILINPINE